MNNHTQAEPFDIFWVDFREEYNGTSVQCKRRPAMIATNSIGSKFASVLTVIPMTTTEKVGNRFPYHVPITGVKNLEEGNVLLTEQITTVPKNRVLGRAIAKIESDELKRTISQTLTRQLGLLV